MPDADELKERLLKYLNYMSSRGITTLWDAGNFNMDDAVYQAAHDIAREGNLPLRWEGSHHIWAPEQIETAVESLVRLREKYAHGKLQFDSLKIHYDGLQDILTAAMLEPYVTDPDNYGGVLFTTERLSGFMQELDAHRIDLHMHASGDRATRNSLDAVKEARDALGRPLGIEVTISHLFSVADSDVARFQELGVHANFTPHWFGGTAYGDAREINVGPERAGRSQLVGQFMRKRVNVTLSSDVVYNALRVSPFIGVEMSMTRRALGRADAPTMAAAGRQDFAGAGAGGLYGERRRAARAARTDRRHQGGVAGGLHRPSAGPVRNGRGENLHDRAQRHGRGRGAAPWELVTASPPGGHHRGRIVRRIPSSRAGPQPPACLIVDTSRFRPVEPYQPWLRPLPNPRDSSGRRWLMAR